MCTCGGLPLHRQVFASWVCVAIGSLLICEATRAQDAWNLPLDSPVYDDLEHFRSLGFWWGSLESRPIPIEDAARITREILHTAITKPVHPGDRRRLKRLRLEILSASIPGSVHEAGAPDGEGTKEAVRSSPSERWRYGLGVQFYGSSASLDSLADLDRRSRREQLLALALDAAFARHVGIQLRLYEDYSAVTPFPGRHRWVDNLPTDARGVLTDPKARNDRAIFAVGSKALQVRVGREDRRWGSGRRGTLFLSENAFPMDGVSLRLHTRLVDGVSLFAQTLRGPNPQPASSDPALLSPGSGRARADARFRRNDAYFAAHRLEIHPPLPLQWGIYEAVAYGGRGIDLAYVNPVGILVAMTQDIADRSGTDDKKVVGTDLLVAIPPFTAYGEFLINRIVSLDSASEGKESPISSFAQLAGLRWGNPLGFAGDFEVEYAHLDPEVYFHYDNDPTRSLMTEGELIGHWAGPNSDAVDVALSSSAVENLGSFRIEFEQVRWGLIDGLRGVQAGYVGLKQKDKRWIVGPLQVEKTYSVAWRSAPWKALLPGRFESTCTLAHVDRTGAWPSAVRRKGWQLEVRLRWSMVGEMAVD